MARLRHFMQLQMEHFEVSGSEAVAAGRFWHVFVRSRQVCRSSSLTEINGRKFACSQVLFPLTHHSLLRSDIFILFRLYQYFLLFLNKMFHFFCFYLPCHSWWPYFSVFIKPERFHFLNLIGEGRGFKDGDEEDLFEKIGSHPTHVSFRTLATQTRSDCLRCLLHGTTLVEK